jgi:hypothetical protein
MLKILNSTSVKNAINKILLVFIFYWVANVAFSGYVMKWSWVNEWQYENFSSMYEGTAYRPFVHRRLLFESTKKIESLMSEKQKLNLTAILQQNNITGFFSHVPIESDYYLQYHLVYFISFSCLFAALFVLRKIGEEVTGSLTTGTLAACCFGLLFPMTDSRYFYDFSELLFFSLAILFSLKGWWQALLILSPIAEYNKESFLIFLVTLFPILAVKLGNKKAEIVRIVSIILSGCVYMYVKSVFEGNPGGIAFYKLPDHFENILACDVPEMGNIQYGMFFGYGMFSILPLMTVWIIKSTWGNLSSALKDHFKIALRLNILLYWLYCEPDEIRNFSLLYIGIFMMLAFYIKEKIADEKSD